MTHYSRSEIIEGISNISFMIICYKESNYAFEPKRSYIVTFIRNIEQTNEETIVPGRLHSELCAWGLNKNVMILLGYQIWRFEKRRICWICTQILGNQAWKKYYAMEYRNKWI